MNSSVKKYLGVERGSNSAKQFDIERNRKTQEILISINKKLDLITNKLGIGEALKVVPEVETSPPEVPVDDEQKELLVEEAHKLKIGSPSTLRRWGVQKLEDAIAKASAELE